MIHSTFIRRQLNQNKKQSLVFILCVALSMVTLVGLGGFQDSINTILLRDARALQAGDIIIRSSAELSPAIAQKVAEFKAEGLVERTQLYSFLSVVRVEGGENTLLSNIKAVEPAYPFYGEVELASGQKFDEVLQSGQVVVAQNLLDRLNIAVGDQLRIGLATLTIADVVTFEPDRPVNAFTLGPRIFVRVDDLPVMDLIKPGSRVQYTTLLKVFDEGQIDPLAEQLKDGTETELERIDTYRTASSGIQRFFDNFLFFLSLIGIFTLLLAGIGTQTSLTAFLLEREKTIAIIKTVGASSGFILKHYFIIVAILGLIGTSLGLILGYFLQQLFPFLLAGFLPPNVELGFSPASILESLVLGMFVVGAFTFLPLYNLKGLRPRFIFRKEVTQLQRGWPYYLTILLIFLFFVGLVLWQLQDVGVGLYFVVGVLALILVDGLIVELTLRWLRKRRPKSLMARQALRGLFRPRNATRAIVITLSASLGVIFAIFLIEQNLNTALVESYPEDAPNVFMVDIQPEQLSDFKQALGMEATYYPVIRGLIIDINGQAINRATERERAREEDDGGDNLARQFSFTYRDELLDNEKLVEGESLFDNSVSGGQVSILDEFFPEGSFNVGDKITFRIQGVPLEATVVSKRARTEDTPQPFFTFVFRTQDLEKAPQSIFTAVRLDDRSQIAPLQNRLVGQFPNVSVIDITGTIERLAEVAGRLSQVIRFLALFSIAAGLLIIISSVLATRFARIQEAVYYKVLGAKSRFVLNVFTLENVFLGLISGSLALILAQVGSWLICLWVFEIDYFIFIWPSLLMLATVTLLVTGVGLLASVSILRQRPIVFLRESSAE